MAAAPQIQWTLGIFKETDADLRNFLQETAGEASPLAVTRFVDEAVKMHLLDLQVNRIREAFADLSAEEVEARADEAIAWARSPEGRACE
jgi:hypothetical protein